jgi:Phage integrase, N-terminal SAM-like domain
VRVASLVARGVGDLPARAPRSKTLKLDSTTARTYADALENHILPALGDYFYDALSTTDVQRWIDDALPRGWTSEKRGSRRNKTQTMRRSYSRSTVLGWFRVFRTMTRNAMAALGLQRDPTLRITIPEDTGDVDEANSLSPTQLAAFLTAMRTLPAALRAGRAARVHGASVLSCERVAPGRLG